MVRDSLRASEFGIFDAFPEDSGQQAHLSGQVAKALEEQGDELFARPPQMEPASVIAAKLPG